MLNLLFISNSPKMDFINKNLQPLLKVKIDVVTDFDHGLKDVFEKRPATIIIQDQISGVTGESVARHIQMLLGSGAPVFVLMHEGNTRIKPIKGLFEHIIDLTQPEGKLVEDIQAILKSILGLEWEKIFIKPKMDAAALVASYAKKVDRRVDADLLVDDFLSDLGSIGTTGQEETPAPSLESTHQQAEVPLKHESSSDELARLLVESAQQSNFQDTSLVDSQPFQFVEPEVPAVPIEPKTKKKSSRPAKTPIQKSTPETVLPEAPPLPEVQAAILEAVPEPRPGNTEQPVSLEPIPAAPFPDTSEVATKVEGLDLNAVPPSPADFRVIPASQEIQEQIPEDLLLAFEENYHTQASTWKRLTIVVVVIIVLAAAGWGVLTQKPDLLSFSTKMKTAPATPVLESGKPITEPVGNQAVALQKPVSTVRKPAGAVTSALPSFMSSATRDSSFVAQEPGWERYVGKIYEYRIFRSDGNIKVYQVLAGIGTQTVNDSFLVTVLKEVVGNADYSVNSRERKQGYLIQRGRVGQKADLLIYRSKKSGAIRAFVVSLN